MEICENNSSGTTGRRNISEELFLNSSIPLPPIDIQEKIVENYQNKITEISNLKSQNEIIEQNAKDYLLQTLGLDSSNSQSKFDETDKILRFKKYSKIKDWSVESNFRDDNIDNNEFVWLSLQKISSYIQRGKTPVYSNFKKIPVISQKCNQFDGFHLENALFISPDTINKYSNERFLQENDLLLNSTGTGTLGRVALFVPEKEYPIVVADGHVTVIRINKNVNYKYIFYTFKFINNQEKLDCISVGSTKQKELSLSIVKDIQIPLPPLDIQKQIVEYLDDLQRQIDDNKAKISNLEFLAKDEFEKAVFG